MSITVIEQLRKRTRAMKIREVADLLNLDSDTVSRYADEGKIPAFRVGSRWRVDPEALAFWIEAQNIQSPTNDAAAMVEDEMGVPNE